MERDQGAAPIWAAGRIAIRALMPAMAPWRGDRSRRGRVEAVAEAARATVELLDLGEPGGELVLRSTRPPELAELTVPLLDTGEARRLEAAAGRPLPELVPEGRNWGVRVTFHALDAELLGGADLGGPVAGPYRPADRPQLASVVRELTTTLWEGMQAEALAGEAIRAELGAPPEVVFQAYARELLARDVEGGMADRGQSLDQDDARLRARQLDLARRWRAAGDLARAAMFSLAALTTLVSESFVSSAARYTLASDLLVFDDGGLVPDRDGSLVRRDQVAREILEEFADLEPRWARLRAGQHGHEDKLGRLASEGVAVWREFASAAFLFHDVVHPLFPHRTMTPADVLAQYEHADPEGFYTGGFRLTGEVARAISPWLFTSAELGGPILWMPLRLLARRLPVADLQAIAETSLLAPNRRLRVLASVTELTSRFGWPDDIYQALDRHEPGLLSVLDSALARHEQEAP